MIIGITGKSGSGKSHFSEMLVKINPTLIHIDIDKIGHAAFEVPDVKKKLIEVFGADIIKDGIVDRKQIADLVFTNRHLYQKMSDVTWEYMQKLIDEAISDTTKSYILDWLLLPHSHYIRWCDARYLIKRDEQQRINAVLKRDGITLDQMAARDSAGIEYNEQDFDFVITNNGSMK